VFEQALGVLSVALRRGNVQVIHLCHVSVHLQRKVAHLVAICFKLRANGPGL
jgi:hypothetical protein